MAIQVELCPDCEAEIKTEDELTTTLLVRYQCPECGTKYVEEEDADSCCAEDNEVKAEEDE